MPIRKRAGFVVRIPSPSTSTHLYIGIIVEHPSIGRYNSGLVPSYIRGPGGCEFLHAPRARHPYNTYIVTSKGFSRSIALFVSRSLCVLISQKTMSRHNSTFRFYVGLESQRRDNNNINYKTIIHFEFYFIFIFQLCCKKYQNGQHVQPDIGLLSRSSCTHHRWYRVHGQGVGREIATLVSKHRMYIPIN